MRSEYVPLPIAYMYNSYNLNFELFSPQQDHF